MTFEETLQQTINILQNRGRVSYRALKRQFDLDDAYLEDLKEEILYTYPQVTEEAGRGLVWTGTGTTASPAEAERRQLTVMFCDLADSSKLAGQLDPEDLREVIRAYQETAVGVVQRHAGYPAQYLGDGLLIYFGWPQAHEDDAQRGVRAGLRIVEAIGTLNTRLEREKGVRLVVRIGIHTGLVVIGEVGGGGRHEQLALGETPNIGSRLEELAAPNTVVISATTARLVQHAFTLEDLGLHALKGVVEPLRVLHVVRERVVAEREVAVGTASSPALLGRAAEMALLLDRWAQSKDGQGQVGLVSGEAGIGKSRLLEALRARISQETAYPDYVPLFPVPCQQCALPDDYPPGATAPVKPRRPTGDQVDHPGAHARVVPLPKRGHLTAVSRAALHPAAGARGPLALDPRAAEAQNSGSAACLVCRGS